MRCILGMYTPFTSNVNTVYKKKIVVRMKVALRSRNSYHHGDLREALLNVAEVQLEEEGPAGLSLRKLGRELGVTPGAPYRHFEDKDALLAALATVGFRRLRDAVVAEQHESLPGEECLRHAGIGYITFAARHPELFRLMFGWMPSHDVPELRESADAAFHALVRIITQCEEEGALQQSPIDAGLLAWSSVHGAAFLLIDGGLTFCSPDPDPTEIGNRVHDALWAGIGKKDTRPVE